MSIDLTQTEDHAMKLEKQLRSHSHGSRSRNRRIIMAAGVVVLAMGWYLFRPELIFISRSVN